ncbi:MAG: DNA repair protein RadC [Limisphaerales bacterium]|nr:MAG: DNA repair protein RadC [Limisphaerales bacterium]KAG0508313.1 MAG: DNA repair protein RadC [Limisphaerales bacterium]TXT49628.1 MAG: DNA repair protein RadC [Limisphaerales bacterium]
MSGPRIKDIPASERPRERLAANGADSLGNSDLIAILLRTGLQGKSALVIGAELLAKFQTLDRLSQASVPELCAVKGIGRDKAVTLKAAFTLARRMAAEIRAERPLLDSPERISDWLREDFRATGVERLVVLLLDTRRRLIRVEELAHGTLDAIHVHAREVFKHAITANAAAIALAHNHPSGDPTPSEADIKVTRDLIRAGQLLKIEVVDHVILGRRTTERERDYASLRELGYFYA